MTQSPDTLHSKSTGTEQSMIQVTDSVTSAPSPSAMAIPRAPVLTPTNKLINAYLCAHEKVFRELDYLKNEVISHMM